MKTRTYGTISTTAITLGTLAHLLGPAFAVLNQLPGPFLAVLNRLPLPVWTFLAPLSYVCFVVGIAAHLLFKGHQPLKRTTFYALAVVAAIPVFGPIAALMKIHSLPAKKKDRNEQLDIVMNVSVVIFALMGVLYWGVLHHLYAGYHVRRAVAGHVASARIHLAAAAAQAPGGAAPVREEELEKARQELEDALSYGGDYGRNEVYRALGDVYFEIGDWTASERNYRESLAALSDDPVIAARLKELQARKNAASSDPLK